VFRIAKIPLGTNQLRLGESLFLGKETAYGVTVHDCYDDIFHLEAEVIELKEKASVPTGMIGKNAFGETPSFEDIGMRRRAILAIGQQD
jgi:predicted amino acid racemase